MRVIHDVRWSQNEVENYRHQVFNNLTYGLKMVYDALQVFDLKLSPENEV
jgi:guanine nucleotide-binding protein subunit alpha